MTDKPLVWLHGEIRTPPLSAAARIEAGVLLRRLQRGGVDWFAAFSTDAVNRSEGHELRIQDEDSTWRIVYRLDPDAVIILEVFSKKTSQTPKYVISACMNRLRQYDQLSGG
jgi:phage-related protein